MTLAQLENLAALGEGGIGETGEKGDPVEWWDFFNNYEVEVIIPVNTENCYGGTISYKGLTITIGDCYRYTAVIYHYCYDGGERDECTSSHVQDYI